MRSRFALLIAASLLLPCSYAFAQDPPPPPTMPTAPATPTARGTQTTAASGPDTPGIHGTLDLGAMGTTADGDEARYERYRDTRSGAYTNLFLSRESASWILDAGASHIGYRDQRYHANAWGAKFQGHFDWTSNPLNFSYLTRTPYTLNGSYLSLSDAAQAAVQAKTAVGVPCAPGAPPAACNSPAQAAQALANRSIYDGLANPFDLRYTRDAGAGNILYSLTSSVDLDASFKSTKREGNQPWGASFAFNNAVEIPLPIDQRTSDASLGASWGNERTMFRVGWDGSWFSNAFRDITWDNPIFLTDFNNGLQPPLGPYDPSGYSNGNGPGLGRLAAAPDNTMQVFSVTGLHKAFARTTFNGTAQVSLQKQNDTLIPFTTNALINQPLVFAAFPHIAQLPRNSAEAEARGINTLLNMSARPWNPVSVTVRYRYTQRDVRTPIFDATEYVRFDAVPEENPEGFSPQFDNSHHYFDAALAYTLARAGTIRIGYAHEQIHREGRGFADVGEHTGKLSYDVYSNQFVAVRTSVEIGRRRGSGFVDAASGGEDTDIATGPGGTQPTLRYYDEADRDRTRGTFLVTVMPHDTIDFYVQFAGGKDTFLADSSFPVSRPGEYFGLQRQSNTSWSVGANYHPTKVMAAGVNYSRDGFGSLERSRNANPPPDPTWTDPSRDWTLDNGEHINSFSANADLLHWVRKTDIRFGYDYSDSDNAYTFGGPRIAALASINQFIPLPNVTNKWQRATADVQYFVNNTVGVALSYYFEKLGIVDFSTIDTNGPVGFTPATGTPRIDYLGELMLGYGNRPYSGSSGMVRLLYRF
jgi:hypothetical protein